MAAPAGTPRAAANAGMLLQAVATQVLLLLLGQAAMATALPARPLPPACTNLTGDWCCLPTSLRQNGSRITTAASYGHGFGNVSGHSVAMYISNMPAGTLLRGIISSDCSSIKYSTGNEWTRTGPYTPGPPPFAAPPRARGRAPNAALRVREHQRIDCGR